MDTSPHIMINLNSGSNPRILICRFRHLGDVILSTPLIHAIRQAYPEAFIAYLTEEKFAAILENNPHLDQIIATRLNRKPFESRRLAFSRQIKLIRQLRQLHFDLIIDLFGSFRSSLYAWLSGTEKRIGGNPKVRRFFHNYFQPEPGQNSNIIDQYTSSLRLLDIQLKQQLPEVFLAPEEKEEAFHYLRSKGLDPQQPIIGLHPGATWPTKIWDYSNYAQLAQKLSRAGLQVFVTCRPGEEKISKSIAGGWIGPVIIGDILPVRRLAAVIQHFFIHVSNDCGVMHLSAAVGTPTFGVFGPGEPNIWFPYSAENGHHAFWQEMDCRPCFSKICAKGDGACLQAVDHRDVFEAIIARIDKYKARDNTELLGED